jgi:hypothetical protein
MSVGTWILTLYGPFAGLAGAAELRGLLPRRLRDGSWAAARASGGRRRAGRGRGRARRRLLHRGAADQHATPTWHAAHRHLPFVFVGSASAASGGLAMLLAPVDEAGPARRLAVGGAVLELAVERQMESRMGLAAEPLHHGHAGALMRASKALTAAGAVGALVGGRSRTSRRRPAQPCSPVPPACASASSTPVRPRARPALHRRAAARAGGAARPDEVGSASE